MLNVGDFTTASRLINKIKTWPKKEDQINAYNFLYEEIKRRWQEYMEAYYHSHKHSYANEDGNITAASVSLDGIDYTQYLWQPNIDTAKISMDGGLHWFIHPNLITDILSHIMPDSESGFNEIQNNFLYIVHNDILNNTNTINDFLNNYHNVIERRK